MSAAADKGIIKTARRRRSYWHPTNPDQMPLKPPASLMFFDKISGRRWRPRSSIVSFEPPWTEESGQFKGSKSLGPLKMSLEKAQKVIVPQKKNYVPQFLKQRDINSYTVLLVIYCMVWSYKYWPPTPSPPGKCVSPRLWRLPDSPSQGVDSPTRQVGESASRWVVDSPTLVDSASRQMRGEDTIAVWRGAGGQ